MVLSQRSDKLADIVFVLRLGSLTLRDVLRTLHRIGQSAQIDLGRKDVFVCQPTAWSRLHFYYLFLF